jgi:3-deoxy-D-manno-octulosonic-acid transferase
VIWIHAVSVGEAKSAKGLLSKLKQEYPCAFILATTATGGGLDEAKRSLKEADAISFMPFDCSWVMRKWVRVLQPKLLLLVESDFWIQHMRQVKKQGGQIVLVSGKISERSANRFAKVPFFANRLFSLFDHVLVQNEEYRRRFALLLKGDTSLQIGGNLKLDALPEKRDMALSRAFAQNGLSIAVISTHAPEEEELLAALQSLSARIYLAPRHPERFGLVAKMLEDAQIPYCRWGDREQVSRQVLVVLVDVMGQIPNVCALCDIAIVAGSFSSRVGGHNILEPTLYGLPVLFGPSMHNQNELAIRVLQAGAGKQVKAEELAAEILQFSQEPQELKKGVSALLQQTGRSLETTWTVVYSWMKNQKAWR